MLLPFLGELTQTIELTLDLVDHAAATRRIVTRE